MLAKRSLRRTTTAGDAPACRNRRYLLSPTTTAADKTVPCLSPPSTAINVAFRSRITCRWTRRRLVTLFAAFAFAGRCRRCRNAFYDCDCLHARRQDCNSLYKLLVCKRIPTTYLWVARLHSYSSLSCLPPFLPLQTHTRTLFNLYDSSTQKDRTCMRCTAPHLLHWFSSALHLPRARASLVSILFPICSPTPVLPWRGGTGACLFVTR